jgi:hypothetical protein
LIELSDQFFPTQLEYVMELIGGRMTTPAIINATKTLQRIRRSMKRLMDHAMAFPQRVCYRDPHPEHVSHIARSFRSPFTHSSALLNLFMKDQDFAKVVPVKEAPLILEIGANANEIRANFYPLDDTQESEAHDPNWTATGIFRYTIDANGNVQQIVRKSAGVKYDKTDVIYSYSRPLDHEERELLMSLFL